MKKLLLRIFVRSSPPGPVRTSSYRVSLGGGVTAVFHFKDASSFDPSAPIVFVTDPEPPKD